MLQVLTNPVPLTVKRNCAPPASVLLGEILVMVGTAALIGNDTGEDVPPPGEGLKTVTGTDPAVTISEARICAVSCAELTNVVVWGDAFQSTDAPFTKLEPFTVSVNAAPPAVALLGESELIVGMGLLTAPSRMLTLLVPLLAIARSVLPSPLNSPTATPSVLVAAL